MGILDEDNVQKVLALAKDLASGRTDEGLDKAAEILLHTIDEGSIDSEILVTAASYLLQGSHSSKIETKKEAISLINKAVALAPDNIVVLETAIHCYELVQNDFPEKLNDVIRLCLKVLDLNPDHVECMITLATYRENPSVALSLEDTIRMLEWAQELEPNNIYVAFTLARLYSEAGLHRKARKLYQQVESNSKPDSEEYLDARNQTQSLNTKNERKKYRKYSKN